VLGWRYLVGLDTAQRWAAVALRLTVLILTVLMLAGLQMVKHHTDLTVVAVIDRSESVRRLAQPPFIPPINPQSTNHPTPTIDRPMSADDWIKRWFDWSTADRQPNDRLAVLTYDARPTVRSLPTTTVRLESDTTEQPADGTNTAAAIRLGMALFPPDTGKRMILVSDGHDSDPGDDLYTAAFEARAAKIPIDVLPIEYQVHHEAMVTALYAPTQARQDQTVPIRVVLRATEPVQGLLHLKHDGIPVDLNGPAPGTAQTLQKNRWVAQHQNPLDHASSSINTHDPEPDNNQRWYITVHQVDLTLTYPGTNRFEAVFEPAKGQDSITNNNSAQAVTIVQGQGKLLVVNRLDRTASSHLLPDLLRQQGIMLDVVPSLAIPDDLMSFQRYDAVILQDVPAEMASPKQQQLLARYVRDLGGGLIMVGGPNSFGAGGWTNTPIDKILPVECQLPSQTVVPWGALVLVLDRSGSMDQPVIGSPYSKQDIANEAAILALNTLYPQDKIGVVAFDDTPRWIGRLAPNSNPRQLADNIRKIQPGGGTRIYPALAQAYNALAKLGTQDGAIKHVILLTDGQSHDGRYQQLVAKMVRAGITLSTIGIGQEVNAKLLSQLAQSGRGQYYPINDPNNLPRVFIKEARTVRQNLVKEVTFLPRVVGPSPITDSLGPVPKLKGFVLTGVKQDPRVNLPMVGPKGEPLLAHWRVGVGSVAAWTSDTNSRWASPWLQWDRYADFWTRAVKTVARPPTNQQYQLRAAIKHNTLHVQLDTATGITFDPSAHPPVSATPIVGGVLSPDGSTTPIRLVQSGPGLYEASSPAKTPGSYVISLMVTNPDGQRHTVLGKASQPHSQELRRFRSNHTRLERVAQITGGRVLTPDTPAPDLLFHRQSPVTATSIRPVWRTLMIGLFVVFLLDIAARRIAWDLASIKLWITQAQQRLRPRQADAVATLQALKRKADQVSQRLSTHIDPSDQPTSDLRTPHQPATKPKPDVTKPHNQPTQQQDTRTKPIDPDAPTTQRLLKAKQRAQDQMNYESPPNDT